MNILSGCHKNTRHEPMGHKCTISQNKTGHHFHAFIYSDHTHFERIHISGQEYDVSLTPEFIFKY